MNLPIFLERNDDVVTAGSKRGVPCTIQGHSDKLVNFNMRRRPATAINAAIDPVDVAVRAT